MDLKNLKYLIDVLIMGGMSDSFATREILEFLYNNQSGSLREMVLMIDEIEKEKSKDRENLLYRGLEDAMHGFSSLAESITIGTETSKNTLNVYFGSDNPAFLLFIARAYFKDATSDGCSASGKYFFNRLVSLIVKTRAYYLPDGMYRRWAIEFGHLEYIEKILANYDKNVPKNLDLT